MDTGAGVLGGGGWGLLCCTYAIGVFQNSTKVMDTGAGVLGGEGWGLLCCTYAIGIFQNSRCFWGVEVTLLYFCHREVLGIFYPSERYNFKYMVVLFLFLWSI